MQQLREAVLTTCADRRGPIAVVAALDADWEGLNSETLATLRYGEPRSSTGELIHICAVHRPPVQTEIRR